MFSWSKQLDVIDIHVRSMPVWSAKSNDKLGQLKFYA